MCFSSVSAGPELLGLFTTGNCKLEPSSLLITEARPPLTCSSLTHNNQIISQSKRRSITLTSILSYLRRWISSQARLISVFRSYLVIYDQEACAADVDVSERSVSSGLLPCSGLWSQTETPSACPVPEWLMWLKVSQSYNTREDSNPQHTLNKGFQEYQCSWDKSRLIRFCTWRRRRWLCP